MITRDDVVRQLLAYLNGELALPELVRWAEDTLFILTDSSTESPDEAALIRILGYLGAGDTPDFPLTWDVLTGFLDELDTRVRVMVSPA